MTLEKAYILQIDAHGNQVGEKIPVMFNPSEYSIDKNNQFASLTIPGLSTPLMQFVSGGAGTLTMDLFFDTYEKKQNVRIWVDKVIRLLAIDEHLHAPPQCKFIWGEFQFKATVEKIVRKFTMFLSDGTPVRATLNVTFKEYRTLSEQIQCTPMSSADRSKERIFIEGDSLWLMAYREYGDPEEWKRIAIENNIEDPRRIDIGKPLRLPPVEELKR